jgi:putative MATE family efflux protein
MAERPSDRRILALAIPALGALAAEPLYLLVDTAVVGHLGREALAGLAVGAGLLGNAVWLMSFLAYGTTGRTSRLFGAGRRHDAVDEGMQATWLGVAVGTALVVILQLLAEPLATIVAGGGNPQTIADAVEWLRIASLGGPLIAITLAGQGWLRGVQDMRTPLVILIGSNAISAALAPALVYGLDMGLPGSAVANVCGQVVAAALFLGAILRERTSLRPRWEAMRGMLATARDLGLRTIAMETTFISATAAASRLGPTQVAAHLIAIQLWFFLALTLDAFAIAAQALIGELLGGGEVDAARALARRLCELGAMVGVVFGVALLLGWHAIPRLFTGDAAVVAATGAAWGWFALMQPFGGIVFAIDGILIGAGDNAVIRTRTVLSIAVGYVPCLMGTIFLGWGLTGIWIGLTAFILMRFLLLGSRVLQGGWAVGGATA